jgi:hypothetical protein
MTDEQSKPGVSKLCLLVLMVGLLVALMVCVLMTFVVTHPAPQPHRETASQPTQQTVRINGHEITADPGSRIIVEGSEDVTQPVASRTLTQAGESKGVGVTTTERGVANTSGVLPTVNLNGSASSGGSFAWHFEAAKKSNSYLLYIFAAIFAVLGAVLLYFGLRGLAFTLFALSAAFGIGGFMVETYPAVLLVVVVVGLGAGGYFLYHEWRKSRESRALRAVVAGVEHSPKEAREAVKPHIAEAAGNAAAAVKHTITSVKASIGDSK